MDALSAVTVSLVTLLLAVAAALAALAHRLGLLHQLLHPVDPRSPRHGGELVAAVLKAHGVRFVFALAGGHISPILVACEKIGVRVVDTRHEATAVFAADAVSRLSGGVGVAVVTAGPGVTNTITAVKNAQLAESPLLLIGGAAATLQKGRGALQDVEQLPLFRTLCKSCLSVRTVRDLVPCIRQAMATARSGTPGPVFVELPIDVLYPFHVVEKEIGATRTPRGLRGMLVTWYLRNYIRNLFAGAWKPQDLSPLPIHVPQATQEEVQRCAELLSRAKKPLVLLGSQAMLPPTTPTQLCSALESLGIPCYLGGASRGLLPPDSPILLRQNRRDALRDADLVLLAGAVCDFRLSYGRLFNRGAAIVAVNRDREQLLRNSDVFWKPRLAVQGDVASFVVRLAQSLSGFSCPKEWGEQLREAERRKEKEIRTFRHVGSRRRVRSRRQAVPARRRGLGHLRRWLLGLQLDGVRHLRAAQDAGDRAGGERRVLEPDRAGTGGAAGEQRGMWPGLPGLRRGGRGAGRPGVAAGPARAGAPGAAAAGGTGHVSPRPPRAAQRPHRPLQLPRRRHLRLTSPSVTGCHQSVTNVGRETLVMSPAQWCPQGSKVSLCPHRCGLWCQCGWQQLGDTPCGIWGQSSGILGTGKWQFGDGQGTIWGPSGDILGMVK
ncbi:2-hydroxyacyl-CoA lyase 2 isoform X2 [Patagioenas fasciata]|uniref:2-hydroxyacyl-CoA lyase 2 isoform X2 n=1 Tax=Patagioenas fasciata TaxID=372321 RepID=UPI003A9A2357